MFCDIPVFHRSVDRRDSSLILDHCAVDTY